VGYSLQCDSEGGPDLRAFLPKHGDFQIAGFNDGGLETAAP
jgi:hypothetical protein